MQNGRARIAITIMSQLRCLRRTLIMGSKFSGADTLEYCGKRANDRRPIKIPTPKSNAQASSKIQKLQSARNRDSFWDLKIRWCFGAWDLGFTAVPPFSGSIPKDYADAARS